MVVLRKSRYLVTYSQGTRSAVCRAYSALGAIKGLCDRCGWSYDVTGTITDRTSLKVTGCAGFIDRKGGKDFKEWFIVIKREE